MEETGCKTGAAFVIIDWRRFYSVNSRDFRQNWDVIIGCGWGRWCQLLQAVTARVRMSGFKSQLCHCGQTTLTSVLFPALYHVDSTSRLRGSGLMCRFVCSVWVDIMAFLVTILCRQFLVHSRCLISIF